jgi:hypothetical protein
MTAWTSDELEKITAGDELQLASARRDGTLRKPVTIWVVRHGDDLYVRSVYGRTSSWFRGVQDHHEGHIRAGGVDKDVLFVEPDDDGINEEIDAAYRTKYQRYDARYVDPMASPEARAATIKLVPRPAHLATGGAR